MQNSDGDFAGIRFEFLWGSVERWREGASQEAVQTGEPHSSFSVLPL